MKEKVQEVQEVIDEIRPSLQADGGDVELVSVDDDGTVKVRLSGACGGCPFAVLTLQQGIEKNIKQKVPEIKKVVAVR